MSRRPSAPLVISLLALFVALGGPAQAAKLITAKNVKRNSLTGLQIRNGSLGLADLSQTAENTLRITPNGSVTAAKLGSGAVGTSALAGGAVNADRIANGAVNGSKVADNTLTTNDIAPNAIGVDELAPNSVATDEIIQNSIVGADIRDSAVDGTDVLDGSLGVNDVGRFAGSFTLSFGAIALNSCASRATSGLTSIIASQDIRDDAIVVTPLESFPSSGVSVTSKPASSNTIEVTVCNVAGPANLNLGDRSFRFVSFDTA